MTEMRQPGDDLRELSPPERHDAIEDFVVDRIRSVLMLSEADDVQTDVSYFDLGLTSLRMIEIKEQLEVAFDLDIDGTLLFNRPTIDALVAHLAELLSGGRA